MKIRVLWISFFGSWTLPLLRALKPHCEIEVIVPVIGEKKSYFKNEEGIRFHYIGLKKKELSRPMTQCVFIKYAPFIQQFQPELIHVHGTEKNLAQVQKFLPHIPVVTSIQGILSGSYPFAQNYLCEKDMKPYKTLKNLLGFGGLNLMYKQVIKGLSFELDILQHNQYFIGRTDWDKAHIMFNNPTSRYYRGEELLRPEFYHEANSWTLNTCLRHSIFMPFGFNPIKGLHLAVLAVAHLKQYFQDVKLFVPGVDINLNGKSRLTSPIIGEEFIRYVKDLIIKHGLVDNVVFLPRQDAEGMIRNMKQANVFISPSSIDNSPNAVGEATMIGVPVVTTPVGGVPSFMTDGENALFAPAGDAYLLAYQIKQIFDDDALAEKLHQGGVALARKRHNIEKATQQYLSAYKDIISRHKR